ncbi:acyltransferase family protein [Streptomyces tendae]|uniref:acyltransferase family protein n=1 Tax=Streptomyces tendae TaxID=1932 RepID=UPI0037181A71
MISVNSERAGAAASMPPHLRSLTGLRWVAALMVFLSHVMILPAAVPPGEAGEFVSEFVALGGYVGVSVFFVLSGFVLTWSARATDTAPRFWRRRFFKVYPNHFLAFLVAVAFMVWWGPDIGFESAGDQAPGALPQLLLVHAWVPDLDTAFSFNLVSWSLSVEAAFYLCFPLLLAGVLRIRPDRLWYWAGGTLLAILTVPQIARLLPTGEISYEGMGTWEYWFVYVLPISRMGEFLIGILMARILLTGRWVRVPLWAASLLFLGVYSLALYQLPKEYAIVAATVAPIALLIPAAAANEARGRRSLLARSPMVWLGNVSYAFYLVHFFAIQAVFRMVGFDFQANELTAVLFVLGACGLAVALAAVLYYGVERPMMRRFAVARRPASADAPPPVRNERTGRATG